jgi:hypothetical protein
MEPKVKCLESVESRGVGWHSRSCTVLPLILNGHHSRTNSTHLHPWIFGRRSRFAQCSLVSYMFATPTPNRHFCGTPGSLALPSARCSLLSETFTYPIPSLHFCGTPGSPARGVHFNYKCSPLPHQMVTFAALLAAPGCSGMRLAAPGCSWLTRVVVVAITILMLLVIVCL